MKIFAAPLQGYTTALWRHHHAEICGGIDRYYSPFVRVERGEPRQHDMRDIISPLNANHNLTAQLIFKDIAEFRMLVDAITAVGYREIDLNMGCPFPPQMNKGRGAAMVANSAVLGEVAKAMTEYPEVNFSLKMRLGREQGNEWRETIAIINAMPVQHVTVHPRVGRQQYRGELDMPQFDELLRACIHPVIFNGDITTPEDALRLAQQFPSLHGLMIGRGLLARPTLAREISRQHELDEGERFAAIRKLHDLMLDDYEKTLCGETQILTKIRSFWDYCEDCVPHRLLKQLRKATSLAKYRAALQ
jgi:tRNA-dihydrouridine synthase